MTAGLLLCCLQAMSWLDTVGPFGNSQGYVLPRRLPPWFTCTASPAGGLQQHQ
jgi:hypothetical protein